MEDEASIELVGRMMCDECEAFLGKPHTEDCSKSGLVEMAEATEKFTTPERAYEEEPLLAIDPEAVELILGYLPSSPAGVNADKLTKLLEGMKAFLDAVREVEGEQESRNAGEQG